MPLPTAPDASELCLTGEFVDLRPLRPEHAALTFAWRQQARAAQLHRGAASVEAQAQWIARRPAGEYNFVITLKSGQPVGMLSLLDVEPAVRQAQSGRFLIGDEGAVRGLPVAAEAMKLLYELAFDRLGLRRVHGHIAAGNPLMIKWQKYLGMQEEGRLRQHVLIDGRFQDLVLLGLMEDEYRKTALPRLNALVRAGRAARAATSPETVSA